MPEIAYRPDALRLSGPSALELETDFVQAFPRRHSGMPDNRRAVAWLRERFEALCLDCQTDRWATVNFSRPVELRNLVCRLGREAPREIVLVAHHDQSPATVQGADSGGSGIAILLCRSWCRPRNPESGVDEKPWTRLRNRRGGPRALPGGGQPRPYIPESGPRDSLGGRCR